jgi:hypothetical protein
MLTFDYIDLIIESMDIDDLIFFVKDSLEQSLKQYTDEQLIAEVKEYYPELLED